MFPARRRDRPEIYPTTSPRAEWYDRNPVNVSIGWNGYNITPHDTTIRAQYTVPTGKKAFLGACRIAVRRALAATTLGAALAWFLFAGITGTIVRLYDNTVDAKESLVTPLDAVLLAGQLFFFATADLSTGGAMDYNVFEVITEFDA